MEDLVIGQEQSLCGLGEGPQQHLATIFSGAGELVIQENKHSSALEFPFVP